MGEKIPPGVDGSGSNEHGDTHMTSKQTPLRERDRRQFPRIAVVLPVVLQLKDDTSINVRMFNISPGGMQVRCSRSIAEQLCPASSRVNKQNTPSCYSRFLLPLHSGRVPVEAKCRVMHLSLVPGAPADAEVAIGLKFRRFRNEKSLRHFIWYIEEQLVPLEDYEVYVRGHGVDSLTKHKPLKTATGGG